MTEPEPIGPGALKLVVVDAQRDIMPRLEAALHERIRAGDVRRLGDRALIVYAEHDPADIRDWLVPLLAEGETLLVTEFERWSARGDAVDRRWLLRRGH